MHKKALTVAIAGALAAPMAAQAVDVTLSGHVNRALIIADSDDTTSSEVRDNGSSGTRIRVTGSGEMMDGQSAGVKLEYAAAGSLSLRYAEVYFSGGYGKFTIGQGDQGGEGSVYNDKSGVLGIGHGQDNAGVTKRGDYNYYTSLDGGAGRNERIRYDTPSAGAFSAAVSVGNGDQVSAGIKLSQDFGGTNFSAALGTIQWPGNKSTISGSAGIKFASGVTFSGAWGEGEDHAGMMIPEASPEPPAEPMETTTEATTDPSFFQWTLGYVFGDTSVGGSWYRASDTVNEGSELTAVGVGINHNLPGIGTNVYAAAQSYDVEDGAYETDDSVVMIGARIKF